LSDFTWKDFQARNNNELVAILGNFVNRALVLTQKYFDGTVPPAGEFKEEDKPVLDAFAIQKEKIEKSLNSFKFREALKETMNLARLGNKYLADTEPWKIIKKDEERVKTILHISLQLTANLAILFNPFLPDTSTRLLEFLNLEKANWNEAGNINILKTGHTINKPSLLFEKIEDEVIEKQLNKLKENTLSNENSEKDTVPSKEEINFEDFTKMDIRVATILEAEKVPKTKKLLKLQVDTGVDRRTVISGIAEHYQPEELPGKKVCILLNLAPRKIKGIESQGMLLLSEESDGKLYFIEPNADASNGSQVN
jgi:methionyl-tRNA synthetase